MVGEQIDAALGHRAAALLADVTLRPYQSRAVDLVLAAFAAGHQRALLHAPTGAGKTVIFAALAAMFHAAGLPVLVVAHRRELLSQAAERLRGAGIANPVVYRGARHAAALAGATCVVAAVQIRDFNALREVLGPALVIVDEAHHTPAESYARLLDLFPDAHHVGATATPWWGRGRGLGGYFQTIVTATTVRELTELGHLARVRMFTHPHTLRDLDLRGVAVAGEDYKASALAARVDRPALLGDIVGHWHSHAAGARTLCFAASVEHSRHIVDRFRAAGVAAEHLDGETPEDERAAILARLRAGETRIVSNYAVLTEGFDEPSVGCVILARPTLRAQVYLQSVGRGLRVAEAKAAVVVLDHAGSCLAFGFPDDDRVVSLEVSDVEKRAGIAPVRRCPACGLMVPAAVRECPECAATLREAVPTEEPSGVLVEALACSGRGRDRLLTFCGRTLSCSEWAEELGIGRGIIYKRLRLGWPTERVLSTHRRVTKRVRPVEEAPLIKFDGQPTSIAEVSRATGIPYATLYRRVRLGLSDEMVLSPVKGERTITHNGRTMTLSEASREYGIPIKNIQNRVEKGWPAERVLAPTMTAKEAAAGRRRPAAHRRTFLVNGEELTAKEIASRAGVSVSTIDARLRRGLSGDALIAPLHRPASPAQEARDG